MSTKKTFLPKMIQKQQLERKEVGGMHHFEDNVHRLYSMLTYCRPEFGMMESKFIHKFILPVVNKHHSWDDSYGNIYCQVGSSSRVLFSAHTDTVHHRDKKNKSIAYDPGRDELFQTAENCLGADNTAGVWILLNLIEHGVEGLYIFHRAEESGGQGSGWIADNNPDVLKDTQIAVAFDRKGTTSLITHQMGARTASDAFCEDLAGELGGMYQNDPSGSFTDTESYAHLVPECTNVSVGFENAHTKDEYLSVGYVQKLLDRLLAVDWDNVGAYRDPSIKEVSTIDKYGYAVYDLSKEEIWDVVYNEPDIAVAMLLDCRVDEDDYYAAMVAVEEQL